MKKNLFRSPLVMLGIALGLAIAMWALNFQPVSSDTTKLVAVYVKDANLLDPNSPAWNPDRTDTISNEVDASGKPTQKTSTTVVPLSAQYLLAPQGGSVLNLQARAAWNGTEMAVRVSWHDPTKNVTGDSADQLKTFSDAVAIEFPLEELIPGRTPFRCMGQSEGERRVNIWQWKAERDADLTPNPIRNAPGDKAVKNYIGPGPGYLIDPAKDDPDSKAFYDPQTQTWNVIFKRSLLTGDKANSTQFTQSTAGNVKASQIAFAVWDGGNGERLSKKAVSTWVDLGFEAGDTDAQNISNFTNLGIVLALSAIVLIGAWRLLPNTKRPNR
jgi:DMSO reductase family type II enzyme heme b subunit